MHGLVLGFIASLFVLISGMKLTGFALRQHVGGVIYSSIKRKATSKRLCLLMGVLSTVILQSSSLVTIFVVGFINGGFLSLRQGLCIVLGANLGTTLTSQIFALDTRLFVQPLFVLGVCMMVFEVLVKKRGGGLVLLGLAIVLGGVEMLADILKPLSDSVFFKELLSQSKNTPLLGMINGALVAAILQSSSVTIGMIIVLARNQLIQISDAVAMVLGADLGTCVTAMFASIGTLWSARCVALGHLLFNLFSIFLVVPFWGGFLWLIELTASELPRQIANAHFIYNLVGVLFFIPILDKLADILENKGKGRKIIRT